MKKLLTEDLKLFHRWTATSSDSLQLLLGSNKSHGIKNITLTVACFVVFISSQTGSINNKKAQYLITPAEGSEVPIYNYSDWLTFQFAISQPQKQLLSKCCFYKFTWRLFCEWSILCISDAHL